MSQPIAQVLNNPAIPGIGGLNGVQFFGQLIPALVSVGFTVGAIVFMFMLLVGGVEWIISGGDKARNESAKLKVTNALIGITVLFSFFAILSIVECFFGIGLRQVRVGAFNIGFIGAPFCPAASH